MAKARTMRAIAAISNAAEGENPWGQWKLFITTSGAVYVWNYESCKTVFASGSDGIAVAKRAKDGTVLAVADSQVIVLHKLEKGQPHSYKLKGTDGLCRLLEYAPDGKSLYFTSTIQNAVQTYSIREDRISEIHKVHPSPISTFCASSDMSLLLSTSFDPPTIHIENQSLRTTTVFKPKASSSRVVVSAFHPTRKSIFLLAFADGLLACYDHNKLGKGQHVHQFGHLHDASLGGTGIVAAEFIPGYQARAVTVGEDGRLFVVDFGTKAVVGNYSVGAPVNSLCLRTMNAPGRNSSSQKGVPAWVAAVGTIHGWCFIVDHEGNKIHERIMDEEGGKVLNVEWVFGEVKLPPVTSLLKRKQNKGQPLSAEASSKTPVKAKGKAKATKAESQTSVDDDIASPLKIDRGMAKAAKVESSLKIDVQHAPAIGKLPPMDPPPSCRPPPVPPAIAPVVLEPSALKALRRPTSQSTPKLTKSKDALQSAWHEITKPFDASYMDLFSPVKGIVASSSKVTGEPQPQPQPGRRRSARLSSATAPLPPSPRKPRVALNTNEKIERMMEEAAGGNILKAVSSPQSLDFTIEISTAKSRSGIPVRSPTKPSMPITTMGEQAPTGPANKIAILPTKSGPSSTLMDEQSTVRPTTTKVSKASASWATNSAPAAKNTGATTDQAMLRGIKAIRAKFESSDAEGKKPRGGLALFANYLPNPSVMKPSLFNGDHDEEEKENGDPSQTDQKSEKKKEERAKKQKERASKKGCLRRARSRSHSTESSTSNHASVADQDEATVHDPSEFDLWLNQPSSPALQNKKRKQAIQDDSIKKSTSSSSLSKAELRAAVERGEPSKLRKTVPFEDGSNIIPKSTMKNQMQVAQKPAQPITRISCTGNASLQSTLDPTLQRYLDDMKDGFHKDIQTLQIEMLKQFQCQRKFFEELANQDRKETEKVRDDNQKLRSELAEMLKFKNNMGFGV